MSKSFSNRFSSTPLSVQNYCDQKQWPAGLKARWIQMPYDKAEAILPLIAQITGNPHTIADIVEMLADLGRDNHPLPTLLKTTIEKVGTRSDHIRAEIHKIRYPRLTQLTKDFEEWVKKTKKPSFVSLNPIESFEEPGFNLKARVTSEEEKEKLVEWLRQINILNV